MSSGRAAFDSGGSRFRELHVLAVPSLAIFGMNVPQQRTCGLDVDNA